MNSQQLLILAVDQRPWLTKALWGHTGAVSPVERAATTKAKHLVLDGLLAAVQEGVPRDAAGILVDAELGPGVPERARAAGVTLSVPLERAGLEVYEDEPADVPAYLRHYAPDLAKVLVRYNPEGDAAANALQRRRLAATAKASRDAGARFLFELLVPPTNEQLAAAGDPEAFASGVRPDLTLRAMEEISQEVPVDVWKLESMGEGRSYRDAAQLADSHQATCVLLGAGAAPDQVDEWLTRAATAGFVGFAVGRSIWWDAIRDVLAGATTEADAIAAVAARYQHFAETFRAAAPESYTGVRTSV